MLTATVLDEKCIRFDVTIKSTARIRKYFTSAETWFDAWEKASKYCGDVACVITILPASAQ